MIVASLSGRVEPGGFALRCGHLLLVAAQVNDLLAYQYQRQNMWLLGGVRVTVSQW